MSPTNYHNSLYINSCLKRNIDVLQTSLVCNEKKPSLRPKEALFAMQRSLVCKPSLSGKKIRESCTIAFIKQIAWNLKFAGLLEIYHYRFNAHGVCRRYTSMRNPLQAALRRSCGYNCMRGQCSAKRDLYILLTANGISPPSGNRSLHPCPPTAAPLCGLQWVSHICPASRNP